MSKMIEALRRETKEIHKKLEGLMNSHKIMDRSLSKDELNDLFKVNYKFFKSVEELDNGLVSEFIPLRSDTIKKDLYTNNYSIPEGFQKLKVDSSCKSSMLGVAYVALGSSLGGSVISKQLVQNENLRGQSFTFYSSSQSYIKLWKDFLEYIESDPSLDEKLTCGAAEVSFNYFIDNL